MKENSVESSKIRRPFATGSKPGPDAVDHFLESQGLYRKHVARDASSLFRVISEHIFDLQIFHQKVRQDCASFMESNPKEYGNEVEKNYYNYVNNLRKSRTFGSLLELRVMARMYQRNVILYEPTPNLQTINNIYVQNDAYDNQEPLRIFYSHKDKHFDVIYTLDYVERLAECQAIIYNILYADVFQLPDVNYAVERMLHDQEEQFTLPLSDDPSKYKTQSGEIVPFDSPEKTNCVLKDPKTCHFHNQIDFDKVVDENKDAITVINRTNDPSRLKIYKPIDGFLYNKDKSCVRQLLDEGITPFSYKVAKALDPSIYRNTEFELWSENRKEQRMKWLDSTDFPMKHHFDNRCVIYDYDKCYRNGPKKFNYGKIEYENEVLDESGYMALDDETKKKYIVLDPLPDSYKFHHHFNSLDHFMPAKDSLDLTIMPANVNFRGNYKSRKGNSRYGNHQNNQHRSDQRYSSDANPPMSFVADIERDSNFQSQDIKEGTTPEGSLANDEQQSQQMYYHLPPQNWNNQMAAQSPSPYQMQPVSLPTPVNYQNVMPYGNFSIPPPPQSTAAVTSSASVQGVHGNAEDVLHLIREQEFECSTIDWKQKESVEANGSDLPTDVAVLQFFYNIGVRYVLTCGVQSRLEAVASQFEKLDANDDNNNIIINTESTTAADSKANEKGNLKLDPPPVPTNTPVSSKTVGSNYGPPGNRVYNNHNQNSGYRRPFDRDGSHRPLNPNPHTRKDFKFNSNAKNVQKQESKAMGSSNYGSKAGNGGTFSRLNTANFATNTNQEKVTPPSIPVYTSTNSPTSTQEPSHLQIQTQLTDYNQVYQPITPQPFHQYPPHQNFVPQPHQQQQGVTMIYQISDDGGYTMRPVQQPIPYGQPYPYQYQQAPVFYPIQNFNQQPPGVDSSGSILSSNDSGILDSALMNPIQYYPQYPAPVPVYYTQAPMPQTPHVAQAAPVFQPSGPIQGYNSQPIQIATIVPLPDPNIAKVERPENVPAATQEANQKHD